MRFVGIDPSSATGVTILDQDGNYVDGFEVTLQAEWATKTEKIDHIVSGVMGNLEIGDVITIEGFSYGSKGKGVDFQYGLGHAIRLEMYRQDVKWIEVSPTQVKKFASGNGNASKDNMVIPIYKHWGFEHHSNNVRDAFVLAQIARSVRTGIFTTKYQQDVLKAILAPQKAVAK